MTRSTRLICMCCTLLAARLPAQVPRSASMDALLEHLIGQWRMTGTVRGQPVTYTLDATRVLQRRFVQLHMVDVSQPPAYEALVLIGVDSATGQVIAHWLDRFGAAYSIPHATGTVQGDTLLLNFPYPGGPFRDTFVYDPQADSWYFRLEAGDSTGRWRPFADYQVRRATPSGLIDQVGWLQGCWTTISPTRTIEEHWMSPRGHAMIGMGRTVRGDSLVEYEMVVVRERATQLIYEAHPSGQPSAEFAGMVVSDTSVVFENASHDFPQRVGYRRTGADSLVGWIEGSMGGQHRRIEFPYHRTACAR